jgi:hypothetical protein
MLVMAKCIARAWDSKTAREFFPGIEYEIDSDSDLARLTTVPVGYDSKGNPVQFYKDNEGKVQSRSVAKPPYVFQFDRNATRTKEGAPVEMDYTCKEPQCADFGKDFKNLPRLGLHTRRAHTSFNRLRDDSDGPILKDSRDRKSGKIFTCKTCGEVCPNLYSMGQHNKTHQKVAETEPVPA